MGLFNDDEASREKLEDFISPSDIPLIDVIYSNMTAITQTIEIFRDRNSSDTTISISLAVLLEMLERLFDIKVPADKLLEFLLKYTED